MGKKKPPRTTAVRELDRLDLPYSLHTYKYQDGGGTKVAASGLRVDEHHVIKTLVMKTDQGKTFLVLMHGDRQVSLKALARTLKVKAIKPCAPDEAQRHTGYTVGGISPFGTRKRLPIYMEKTILELPWIYINAGKRGLMAKLRPSDLQKALNPTPVSVAV